MFFRRRALSCQIQAIMMIRRHVLRARRAESDCAFLQLGRTWDGDVETPWMGRASEYPVMKKILIICIGAGDPGYVTVQAVDALNEADVFFILAKGPSKTKLIDIRKAISRPYVRATKH